MKKFMYKSLIVLALVAIAQLAQAQAFFTQNFAGGVIPAGWTTTDGSGQNVVWEYCTGPAAGCADLYGRPQFASTTAANGFMILDSDGYGDIPSNHVSRLTTPNIDCSAASQVFATFESAIGVFEVPSDGNILLRVSNDGGTTWTPYNFIPGLSVNNRWSANPHKAVINITSVAANKPAVMLQWQWTGRYEYWWMLDDVNLTTIDPTPANNLAVSGFYYPVSSFATPASEIGTDTFGFSGYVSNLGTAAQTNVKLKAEVINKTTNVVLFTDQATIASLPVGYMDSLIILPNTFAPELPMGTYTIRYTVSADATDTAPLNNVDGDDFVVTDFIFSKENGPTGALRPGGGGDYAVANLYTMSKASLEKYKALGYEISAATNPGLPLQDVTVTAYLFKVADDVLPDFSNFDDAAFLSNSLELKGIAAFDFPDGAANYAAQAVLLEDVNGGTGVPLETGARYFATIQYTDASNVAFHAYSNATNHTFISSMVYTDSWYLGGFGEDYNAVVRMVLELSTSTDDLPLPESAMKLFPNPVSDVLNLEVSFDDATNATITIADINGRVINIDNRQGLTKEVLTYRLPNLAAGTYLARIATEKGTKTKKFVVAK